jgi:hypothetical protein
MSSLLFFSTGVKGNFQHKPKNGGTKDFLDSESANIDGKFVDSGVKGIAYYTDSTSGYTNSNSKFTYNKNDKYIFFLVGSLIIKKDFELSKLNEDGIIFPSDILGIERDNTTNEILLNILRVLYSIDNDASNGIIINEHSLVLKEEINITDVSTLELEDIIQDAGKKFIISSEARSYYIQTLINNDVTQ